MYFFHINFLRIKYFHLMNALASQYEDCFLSYKSILQKSNNSDKI